MTLPMYRLYSALLAAVLLLSLPYWLWESVRHGKYRDGLRERLGAVPRRISRQPAKRAIWVHAVSVGEVVAVTGLVFELRCRFPQHRVVISTTTATGQKLARKKFGEDAVFYLPLDFEFAIRQYLCYLQPHLIVLAETEFWPNFLRLAHRSGAKIAVVNARISDRSFPGYQRFRRIVSKVLANVDLFLAQTEEDSRRLRDIGAIPDRVEVTGNLKFDAPIPSPPPIVDNLHLALEGTNAGPVLVCGSTMEGEESLLLQAFENILVSHPRTVMILAPRHPQRFAKVAQLLEKLRIRFWRRSNWRGEPIWGGVLLLDCIGELASLYALADIAFVGGSLVPRGGHNIIEPAQYGVPIVVGNHTENFRDIVGLFQKHDAIRIVGPAELPLVFMELLSNESERSALGRRAAETLRSQMGATRRTIEALQKLVANAPAAIRGSENRLSAPPA
ncbi:MAG: 3-deoxy-D-manno-octulosonic acid transferase [Terriglobales bacterium]